MADIDELLKRIDAYRRLPVPIERKRLREGAGLTRAEVADTLGVSSTAVYLWETGRADPGKPSVMAYVELLDRLRSDATARGRG